MTTTPTKQWLTGHGGYLDSSGTSILGYAPDETPSTDRRRVAVALISSGLRLHDVPASSANLHALAIAHDVVEALGLTAADRRPPLGAVVTPPGSLPADSDPARHAGGVA